MSAVPPTKYQQRDTILKMHESGKSFGEIAQELSISRQRVFKLYHLEQKRRAEEKSKSDRARKSTTVPVDATSRAKTRSHAAA